MICLSEISGVNTYVGAVRTAGMAKREREKFAPGNVRIGQI